MSSVPSDVAARELYAAESAKIEGDFLATSDGRKAIEERSALVDRMVRDLCAEYFGANVEKMCLVALGGYGRRALFPYSDIDLLFLCEDSSAETRYREATRVMSRTLWDLRLRVSPANRLLSECEKFHRDNPEFNISLLDSRYLAGDQRLFTRLQRETLPRMAVRARGELLRDISELTRQRHAKEGHTIFHLEPNLKNSPGGLRDYHVACWVALLAQAHGASEWGPPELFWAPNVRAEMEAAFDFLAAARCFLHYRQGRDDNFLSYELQAAAAERGIGAQPGQPLDPADWMRIYFRHARTIYGFSTQLLDEALHAPTSLRERFEGWRSRRANTNTDFSIAGGRLRIRRPALQDPVRLLDVFEFVANNGVKLSREAEEQVRNSLSTLGATPIPDLGKRMRQILLGPHAAEALREMHSSGVLVRLFPEYTVIDSLVMRDFYHHYTVDAHSFKAIENIHVLRYAEKDWERPFRALFSELEQPELLFFSLLFHDVGKGMPADNHVEGSLQAVEQVFQRLYLRPEEMDTIRFLIRDHLAMSANLLRRDIFDPETIRAFAEQVGTPERLKLLCLFTYADIRAVNPEALTPWKADALWQFYVSTANYMSRSLDEERFHAEAHNQEFVGRILALLPSGTPERDVSGFLEGLPRRYVLAHSPEEVAAHFQMARALHDKPAELKLERRAQMYNLTLLAKDRPGLFAGLSGTLASWGMNIWKAEAFANAAGIVLDTFHFTDPHGTLELNPSEAGRLQKNIADVLSGSVQLETLMQGRASDRSALSPKVTVPTQIQFDDASSSHSTLMEIIIQDRPGLLYRLSSALAQVGCNIEVALIDTEGQRAVDAFYLTAQGAKLTADHQEKLRQALTSES